MNDSRRKILERLRSSAAEHPPKGLDNPVRRFDWTPAESLQRFRERLEAARGEVHLVWNDWPQTLFELLQGRGVSNLLYGPGAEAGRALAQGWPDAEAIRLIPYLEPVEACRDALFEEIEAGFTGSVGAIAETGSLVLWPSRDEPRLMSLVPPIHCVLLDSTNIRSTFHALMTEQDWVGRGMPTNPLLISGPSKSADIEQTLAYGVHGPKQLIVLIRRE